MKKLQTICAHLGFKGYKNANKVGTIEIIVRCCKAKKVYDSLWDDKSKNVVQCVFCLLSSNNPSSFPPLMTKTKLWETITGFIVKYSHECVKHCEW